MGGGCRAWTVAGYKQPVNCCSVGVACKYIGWLVGILQYFKHYFFTGTMEFTSLMQCCRRQPVSLQLCRARDVERAARSLDACLPTLAPEHQALQSVSHGVSPNLVAFCRQVEKVWHYLRRNFLLVVRQKFTNVQEENMLTVSARARARSGRQC